MSTHSAGIPPPLPEHPDLRHLKDQAKDLLKAGEAPSLAEAQFQIARHTALRVGRSSRRTSNRCKTVGQLKQAIDANDLERVKQLDDAQPGAPPRSARLRQERAAHVGRRMPRAA